MNEGNGRDEGWLINQKEGNGKFHMVLRIKNRSVFTSEMIHHLINCLTAMGTDEEILGRIVMFNRVAVHLLLEWRGHPEPEGGRTVWSPAFPRQRH